MREMEFLGFLGFLAVIGFFVFKSEYDQRSSELYKLKNYKLQQECPNIRIRSDRTDGDFFISYCEGELLHYEFFRTISERREAIADHEFNGVRDLKSGKR